MATLNGWDDASAAQVDRLFLADDENGCEVLRGDVAAAFAWLVEQIHTRVERVTVLNGWRSRAFNTSVGGHPGSNHISATAIDVNGGRHPYEAHQRGQPYSSGFTAAQTAEVRRILAEADGLFTWGLDFPVGLRDAMHFEITTGRRASAVRAFVTTGTSSTRQEDDMGELDPKQRIPVTGEAATVLGLKEQSLGGMLGYASAGFRQNRRDAARILAGQRAILVALGQAVDERAIAAQVVATLRDDLTEVLLAEIRTRKVGVTRKAAETIAAATVAQLTERFAVEPGGD